MVDARKTLKVLYDEWSGCTACNLGARRLSINAPYVAGEGVGNGIMFIGEGPNRFDEETGRPFSGPIGSAGRLVHDALAKLGFTDYYLTNLVMCRSCEPMLDPATNLPRMKERRRGPPEMMYRESTPTPTQIEACRARLYEEIYLVDPVLIVTLGGTAAETLLGHSLSMMKDHGRAEEISIPGATSRPILTDKKQAWGRRLHGEYRLPVEPNEVKYLLLPLYHPSFVQKKLSDAGYNGAVRDFGNDLRKAVKIYERYLAEGLHLESVSQSDADLSTIGITNESED